MEFPLSKLAYYSWCINQLGETYTVTVEQLDDLYCGFVSGVLYNLGSGKTPEYMQEVGPSQEERFSPNLYKNLWNSLIEIGTHIYPYDRWVEENPESEKWADYIESGLLKENEFNSDPEKWLISFRKKLIYNKIHTKNEKN